MKKALIAACVTLLGTFHLVMIGLYLGPANLAKKEFSGVVGNYVMPLFYQNWHLFSPNPGFHVMRVWVRCTDGNGKTGPWLDPLLPLEQRHYRNRLSSHGTLVHVIQKNAEELMKSYYAKKDTCLKEKKKCAEARLLAETAKHPVYAMQVRFASDVCARSLGKAPSILQMKFLRFIPRAYSRREEPGRWDHVEQVVFAPLPQTRRKG